MITEQQLTDRCTPEIIKKMVGLAEGFECAMEDPNYLAIYFKGKEAIIDSPLVFSTLIHRAVEGFNKKQCGDPYIIFEFETCTLSRYTLDVEDDAYFFADYSPSSLTHAECAMLDCLLDILDRESR